ncbi:MAG: DUF2268 domain-containing protein [Thermales bacterium]|nr:DUF2268 domain-containing protein [Thermales bacterium]
MYQSNKNTILIKTYLTASYWNGKIPELLKQRFTDYLEITNNHVGFKDADDFIKYLGWSIDKNAVTTFPEMDVTPLVVQTIRDSLDICLKTIPNEINQIFVYPTQNAFVKESMNGVSGFTPTNNILILFVVLDNDFATALEETVVHEFNHSIFWRHTKWNRLIDGFVGEGLAEHFREDLVGGKSAPWSLKNNLEECKKWFHILDEKVYIYEETSKLPVGIYGDVFTNPKSEYPHWIG